MSLQAGTRLGPYEIIAPLGAGGMGEVYRARDTRLDRTVAIKILAQHLSSSALRERFEREGRAVASLNHPHICTLHDIGQQDGVDYLVMECLQGETLAERLTKGPLPLDHALRCGVQIADALDRAHRQGVVHRDLKPANIMLTKDGPKVLDFGLAKVGPTQASPPDATHTRALTSEGTILGTLQYMAPEQLEGKEVDARTDIFAFGAVLYEMVTGRKAFEGPSQASVMTAIMSSDPPPISTFQPVTPLGLDHVVQQCLSKNADQRWQTARDVMLELQWIAGGGSEEGIATPVAMRWRNREKLAWSAVLLLLLAVAVLLRVTRSSSTSQPVQVMRAPLLPPSDSSFLPYLFAVSPDGTRVAFVAVDTDGNTALWVRALSTSNAQLLSGTEGASTPFWSPDSRRLGFVADGKLRTVDIGDGSVETLGNAVPRGGTWNRDGTIVFAPAVGPLYRTSHTGGVAVPVTKTPQQGGGESHRHPFFLPDGKHFLYFVHSPDDAQRSGIYIGSLDARVPQRVSLDFADNAAFASGRLLYVRGRSLMAQPFDPDRFQTTGPAVPVVDGVETDVGGRPEFSVSQNGVLVFQSEANSPSRLVWFDGSGKELGPLPGLGSKYPRFSPDGRSLAVSSDDTRTGKYHVRIYDLTRGVSTRLTNGDSDLCPVWSSDGKEITYASTDGTITYLYKIAVDGSAPPQVLLKGARMVPNDWSRDGHLVFMDFAKGPPRLAIYSARDHSVAPFGGESEAQFSPDGKWIAFAGPRGRLSGEIFVQPLLGPTRRLQISNAGGGQPRWSRDGLRIFYLAPDKKLMAVTFDPQRMTASAPQTLFQTRIVAVGYDFSQYDVAPDGRFLINSLPSGFSSPLTLVSGWTALLKERRSGITKR